MEMSPLVVCVFSRKCAVVWQNLFQRAIKVRRQLHVEVQEIRWKNLTVTEIYHIGLAFVFFLIRRAAGLGLRCFDLRPVGVHEEVGVVVVVV